jgi:hypothetical protein
VPSSTTHNLTDVEIRENRILKEKKRKEKKRKNFF